MTEYEQHQQFYQQFNTVVHQHQEFIHSPQGILEVLRDPWKAQPPIVRIEHPDYANDADPKQILLKLRARHTQAGTYTPPGHSNGQK